MKLKTLNELPIYTKEDISRDDFVGIALHSRKEKGIKKGLTVKVDLNPNFVYLRGLKKEAIKHYKFHVEKEYHTESTIAMEFIKEFFNLTEEDLK